MTALGIDSSDRDPITFPVNLPCGRMNLVGQNKPDYVQQAEAELEAAWRALYTAVDNAVTAEVMRYAEIRIQSAEQNLDAARTRWRKEG